MFSNDNGIVIERHRGLNRYNRMIFGQFLEHFHRQVYGGIFDPGSPLSDKSGFRMDAIEALRELKPPVVRWPGGCFVSSYHWLNGVGPVRKPDYDKAWRVEEPNTFGTAEFISWCQLIGAEPYICANAGSGTPEEMSAWLEYCNLKDMGRWAKLRKENGRPAPYDVGYWSIGNENYGDWEMGAKTKGEWGPFVAESAKMMRQVDPSIKLLAAALPDLDWTLNLLRHAGKYLDMVSIHGYWDKLHSKNEPADYAKCMEWSVRPEEDIRKTEQIIAAAGFEGKIGIAYDEWNLRGWHHPTGTSDEAIGARDLNDINSTYTMADAVFSSCFLNSCLRHPATVKMANMAPIVNTRGPLFIHPGGIVKRTTFHILSMYSSLLKDNVVDTWATGAPVKFGNAAMPPVDAIATCDDSMEDWTIILANRDPEMEIDCKIAFGDAIIAGPANVTCLSGGSKDDFNDIQTPNRVIPKTSAVNIEGSSLKLPPHSVTALSFGKDALRKAEFSKN